MIFKIRQAINGLIFQYRYAKKTWHIFYWILFIITIYLPFEEFILKWVPGPDIIALLIRFLPEIILYLLCGIIFVNSFLRRKSLKTTPIDPVLIVAFLIWAIFLIIINKASLFSGINNLRALLRNLSVYYIVVNIKLYKHQVQTILKSIIWAGLIEGFIVIVQYIAPASFNNLFITRSFTVGDIQKTSEVALGSLKSGAVNGTFSQTAVMTTFFLFCLATLITDIYRKNQYIIPSIKDIARILILYFGIFAALKRSGIAIALTIPILVLFYLGRKTNVLIVIFSFICIVFINLSGLYLLIGDIQISSISGNEVRKAENLDINYLFQIFTLEYYEKSSEESRLWYIKVTVRDMLAKGYWSGFSPDPTTATNTLAAISTDTSDKKAIIHKADLFEDVYWVAMLLYYGIPGLLIYLLMLVRLYLASKWLVRHTLDSEYKFLGVTFCTMVVISSFYAFVVRIFEFKIFTFYFWLLAGMVINACYEVKKKYKKISGKIGYF